ncbi:MAG TPA: PEGA domain-containing protein [Polyangiaceae bacterium]|nr:PEGA domain-containing protein [Polyangiaceae bacterium]
MFNRTRHPLLPRFVAAVTASAFLSASIAPAFAQTPAAPAPAKDKAAPAKPAEPKPAEAKPADAKAPGAAPAAKPDAKPADPKAAATPAKPADKPKPPDKKTKDAARKAYTDGEKAFAAGDFAGAFTGFSKANELIPSAQAQYWVAKSLDGQGKVEEAVTAYEKLLADPEISKLPEDKQADAKARLADLKAKLVGEVSVLTTPMGATVSIDGTPQPGETPIMLKLAPGPHKLTLIAPGYEAKEVDVEVKGGEKSEQKIELVAKPTPPPPPPPEPVVEAAPPPPPPPPPPPRSKVPAYITLGIAGAGAIVGTIFGIKALGAKNDFDKSPTGSAADDTERNALIADMAFGVAITLGVTGVVLLTSDDSTPAAAKGYDKLPKKAKLVVAPYASPEGGGAAAQYSF